MEQTSLPNFRSYTGSSSSVMKYTYIKAVCRKKRIYDTNFLTLWTWG